MKRGYYVIGWVCLIGLFLSPAVYGQDQRALQLTARQAKEALAEKAAAELAAAEKEAAESRRRIMNDKSALEAAVKALQDQTRRLQEQTARMTIEVDQLNAREKVLSEELSQTDSMLNELVGTIRINAKDVAAMAADNLQTVLFPIDQPLLQAIAEQNKFPGMSDIRKLVEILFGQIQNNGAVAVTRGAMVNRAGETVEADILTVGCFTAAYRSQGEIGFLAHTPGGENLYALSRLPSGRMQKELARYIAGVDDSVPVDVSRGGALRQLSHKLSLWGQIPKGGPIVWPIVAIFVVGALIVIERVFFMWRKRFDGDALIQRISAMLADKDWRSCEQACATHLGKPVARVVQAGLNRICQTREELENALQEAILKEIPPLERFLSTLGMLAAIAPLLGLLGTVTGMINVFHVITQHGTGDPRLMSAGISEALVTTMLGLAVAIPIMLAHTLLSRGVDNLIGQMEEKAVALVNIVHQYRENGQ